jgi:hypothetical protein
MRPKLPEAFQIKMSAKREHISFDGRKYPIVREASGTYRMRSRTKTHSIDIGLGTSDLREAKRVALTELETRKGKQKPRGSETLEDLTKLYLHIPKRCGDVAAGHNVGRLRKIVELTWNKTMDKVKIHEVGPKLWREFMAKKQGGKLDLASRKPEHAAINSAVKQAASIFIKALRPVYAEHGINIPEDATTIQWLQVSDMPKPAAKLTELDAAIRAEKANDLAMYFCTGLARWAGIRRSAIKGCARHWIFQDDKGRVRVAIHDRHEEGFSNKNNKAHSPIIIDEDFANDLLAVKDGMLIVNPDVIDRDDWFERAPQNWLRPFTGKARKPLHRLRGLYADEVARITEDAVFARREAVKEASTNLGHTKTGTTEKHYLTGRQ